MDSIIEKSASDKCLYRSITLTNGLRALLISDQSSDCEPIEEEEMIEESTDGDDDDEAMSSDGSEIMDKGSGRKSKMAAAALCIGVGSFSDPPELPGLAHFLEHMVFMGSEKYPEENAYDSFISKHGGSDNASTDCETTTYEMEVTPQYLKESLSIFAHCFISPLLKVDSMEREIEAVDDEFVLAVPVDDQKADMLLGSLSKPGHPMAKFMFGNKKSLKEFPEKEGINLNAALKDFYNRYYSAHLMTLAVMSTDSLETLEKYVTEIFSELPNNGMPPPSFDSLKEPFKTEKFNKLYKIIPVKKSHKICLTWALPPLIKQYRSKPLSYISSLLGDEGRGSIISYLRKNALATDLEAGNDSSGFELNSTCSLFSVNVTLSEYGMDHIPEILSAVFQYINMMKREGPKKYIFEERKLIKDQIFKYKSQGEPIERVVPLSNCMQIYPPEHYLTGNELYFDYNEKLIADCVSYLTIDDVNIFITSSLYKDDVQGWEVEPWLQCKYKAEEIPPEWKEMWTEEKLDRDLHLPDKNPFIAENFELIDHGDSPEQYPIKIFEDQTSCLWYKGDTKFKSPKGCAIFHIRSPVFFSSPENSAMTEMLIYLLNLTLSDDTYSALSAGLDYSVSYSFEGITIKIDGFNDKLQLLLETILTGIMECKTDKFSDVIEKHILMHYQNICLKPKKLCIDIQAYCLSSMSWPVMKKIAALKNVTLTSMKTYLKSCFSNAVVDGIVQGNISKEDAIVMIKTVADTLKLKHSSEDELPHACCMKLPYGNSICRVYSFSSEDQNSLVYNYYQLEPGSISTACMTELLMEFMEEPCFDTLRTQKQLGYIVHSSCRRISGVLGFYIKIATPSNKFSCHDVDEYIEEFLKDFLNGLQNIEVDEYNTQLESLIERKKLDDPNMEEEVYRNWCEILNHNSLFDRRTKEIEFLTQLEMADFKNWVKNAVMDASKRKKLAVQVVGHGENIINGCDEKNISDWKNLSDGVMFLRYLPSAIQDDSNTFITNIDDFKQSLSTYPFHKIT